MDSRENELICQLRWQVHVRAGRMQVRQLPQQGVCVRLEGLRGRLVFVCLQVSMALPLCPAEWLCRGRPSARAGCGLSVIDRERLVCNEGDGQIVEAEAAGRNLSPSNSLLT